MLRDTVIIGVQIDVVCDKRFSRANGGCASRGMNASFSEIRLPVRVGRDFAAQAFELAAPDVFQILAIGPGGGSFVQIDRDSEPVGDVAPDPFRNLNAFRE